jgi:glycerophosphoryl diester phosphodiesterase
MSAPLAIAHRGDPVGARENTMAAFVSAVDAGADMVELDLRRTRDGEIVVLHDATLNRLWGVDRAVDTMELSEVTSLGSGALRIPTLERVMEAVEVEVMVDFTRADVVDGALKVIGGAGALHRSLFVTGNVDALHLLRRSAPDARIGLTWNDDGPPPIELLGDLGAEYWNPAFWLVTAERVRAAHEAGYRVSTWTVDDREDMTRMIGAGVDGLVTNQIVRLMGLLGRS